MVYVQLTVCTAPETRKFRNRSGHQLLLTMSALPANIVLTGMPAVGKSTLGVILAKRLGYSFLDTDIAIQTGENQPLRELITDHGPDGFCDLEATYIMACRVQRHVIATGGSVVYREQAMTHMARLGHIVYLDIALGALKKRLRELDDRGVVYAPGQTIDDLYAARVPLYRKFSHLVIPCTGLTAEQTVSKIISALSTH